MDCFEVILELVKIGMAGAALAVAGYTTFNARRVFLTQSEQLRIAGEQWKIAEKKADMDRRSEILKDLNLAPHFQGVTTEGMDEIVSVNDGEHNPNNPDPQIMRTARSNEWVAGEPEYLLIHNKREDVKIVQMRATSTPCGTRMPVWPATVIETEGKKLEAQSAGLSFCLQPYEKMTP